MASKAFLQQAYLAYFGRPADTSGLATYASATEAQVKAAFSASAESQAFFGGLELTAKINAIYQNLFNRDAEPAGLLHWMGKIGSGEVSLADAAMTILANAQNSDKTAVANKLAASDAFVASVDTTAEILGYAGAAAIAPARAYLKSVDATADSLTAAVAGVNAAVAAVVAAGSAVAGQTFNLNTSAESMTGTAGNDTFNSRDGIVFNSTGTAVVTATLQSADAIDGGAGNDTLNVNSAAAMDLVTPVTAGLSVKNVEVVNLSSNAGVKADVSGFTGLNTLNVTEVGGTNGGTVKASTATNINLTDTSTAASTVTISGGKDITATLSGVATKAVIGDAVYPTAGAVRLVLNDLNIASSGGASDVANIVGGTTVSVARNIAAPVAVTGTAATSIGGAISVTGGAATSAVTVTQTAAVTAVAGSAAGSVAATAESAVVTASSVGLAVGKSITIGGLTFTATTAITAAADVAAAFASLTAGATAGSSTKGTYSGALAAGWTSGTASSGAVTFGSAATAGNVADLTYTDTNSLTSVVTTQGVNAIVTPAVPLVAGITPGNVSITDKNSASATLANTITAVTLDGYGTAAINSNALKTLSLANSLAAVTVTDNGAVKNAALDVTVNNIGKTGTAAALTDATITSLNITATGKASVMNVTAAEATTLTIAGDQKLDLTGSTAAKVTSVTSTNTAGVTVTLNAASSGTFGSGNDVVTLGASSSKAVSLGGGNDTVIMTTLATTGTVSGGDGTDVLEITGAAAATASATTAFAAAVTGFEKLTVDGSGTGIDPSKLGGYRDVTIKGTTPTVTLVNTSSGDTLTLTTAGATVTVTQADAAVGANDVLNVRTSAAGTLNAGTVNTTATETVNITTADTTTPVTATTPYAVHTVAIPGNSVKTITVAGNAAATVTAAGTGVTLVDASALSVTGLGAGLVANSGLTWTSGPLAAAGVVKGSATGGDVINASAATAAMTITTYAGTNSITGSATAINTLTGGTGADTIVGGALADVIVGGGGANVITGGAGADLITLSGGKNTIVQAAAGNSGANTATNTQVSILATNFDVVRGAAAGDKIDLTAFANGTGLGGKYSVTELVVAGTNFAPVDNKVVFVPGNYDAATKVFTYAANGLDTAVTYDTGATTTVAAETIILVGYSAGAATTATAGVITLG